MKFPGCDTSDACDPGQIVISGATRHRLASTMKVMRLAPVTLRGRAEPVELFELNAVAAAQNE